MLTGEAMPQLKKPGSLVVAGSTNQSGSFVVQCGRLPSESAAVQLNELVATAQKASGKQLMLDRFAKVYTWVVLLAALLLGTLPLAWCEHSPVANASSATNASGAGHGGAGLDPASCEIWLRRALALTVISCPCAIILAMPLTYACGVAAVARWCVLVKSSRQLELLAKMGEIALDKTGTLTEGAFRLRQLTDGGGGGRNAALKLDNAMRYAAALEALSSHPIAAAFMEYAQSLVEDDEPPKKAEGFKLVEGEGVMGTVDGHEIGVGSERLMKRLIREKPQVTELREEAEQLALDVQAAVRDGMVGRMLRSLQKKAEKARLAAEAEEQKKRRLELREDAELLALDVQAAVRDGMTGRMLKALQKKAEKARLAAGIEERACGHDHAHGVESAHDHSHGGDGGHDHSHGGCGHDHWEGDECSHDHSHGGCSHDHSHSECSHDHSHGGGGCGGGGCGGGGCGGGGCGGGPRGKGAPLTLSSPLVAEWKAMGCSVLWVAVDGGHFYIGRRSLIHMTAGTFTYDGGNSYIWLDTCQVDGELRAACQLSDKIRGESSTAVRDLRSLGVKVVMLTGDAEETAQAVAAQAGIEKVVAGVKPKEKLAAIEEMARRNTVGMMGDGVNDGPALAAADVGIAMGVQGTAMASQAAGIVFMSNDLRWLADAVRGSRHTSRTLVVSFATSILFKLAPLVLMFFPTAGDYLLVAAVASDVAGILFVLLAALHLLRMKPKFWTGPCSNNEGQVAEGEDAGGPADGTKGQAGGKAAGKAGGKAEGKGEIEPVPVAIKGETKDETVAGSAGARAVGDEHV